jgi:transcriptional regulator with XRE-family HTH domain
MKVENSSIADFDFPHISEVVMASERLIFNTTEDILLAMQDSGMNQSDLAKKMGKSAAFVSQVLDGTRNMTLKTLSDISFALGVEIKLTLLKDGRDVSHQIMPEREHYEINSNFIETKDRQVINFVIATPHMDNVQYVTERHQVA